ncbi:hypothetical protein [Paraprevotella xylaniphila]|uniref:hypothetical protein n=1 Tax=Paraprevotella xylaniphila TaxID=454155 RepID=UPI0030785EB5
MKGLRGILKDEVHFREKAWREEGTEKRRNVRKPAEPCGNVHKRAPFAVRTSNFAVKTEAHGTETDRKEGGTPVGGENRE